MNMDIRAQKKESLNQTIGVLSQRSTSVYRTNLSQSNLSRTRLKPTTIGNIENQGPITEEQIKKELNMSFKKIKLDCYTDILRIKQPSKQAINAGQMLCKVVNSFRGGT